VSFLEVLDERHRLLALAQYADLLGLGQENSQTRASTAVSRRTTHPHGGTYCV